MRKKDRRKDNKGKKEKQIEKKRKKRQTEKQKKKQNKRKTNTQKRNIFYRHVQQHRQPGRNMKKKSKRGVDLYIYAFHVVIVSSRQHKSFLATKLFKKFMRL